MFPDGTVVASDLLVEGVHWDGQLSAEDVGFKAVAVNASDMAASGAQPTWMLLDLAVPRGDEAWVEGFAQGLGEGARTWDVDLIGGDTSSVPPAAPRFVAITMAGRTGPAGPLRRDSAQAGDLLVVTGIPGLASAARFSDDPHPDALRALRRPTARVAFALAIAPHVSAAMDLSDGLHQDLPRMCRASGVGAAVDPAALPDHPAFAHARVPAETLQLAGGDDYELLLAVPPDALRAVHALASEHDVRTSVIGEFTADRGIRIGRDEDWPQAPWSHFEGEPGSGVER